MANGQVEGQVPCRDPECPYLASPEQDGDHVYYACRCGMEFGYQLVKQPDDSSCAMGISEGARQQLSSRPEPVMLQIGRRPSE
jgi:hypothetical protein